MVTRVTGLSDSLPAKHRLHTTCAEISAGRCTRTRAHPRETRDVCIVHARETNAHAHGCKKKESGPLRRVKKMVEPGCSGELTSPLGGFLGNFLMPLAAGSAPGADSVDTFLAGATLDILPPRWKAPTGGDYGGRGEEGKRDRREEENGGQEPRKRAEEENGKRDDGEAGTATSSQA